MNIFIYTPIQKDNKSFEQEIPLTGDSYKAFIDISPKEKNYIIEPISIGHNIRNNNKNTILK